MELYSLQTSFLVIPIVGMIRFYRGLWLQILTLGAGLGLACAQDGNGASPNPPPPKGQDKHIEVPTCYVAVPTPAYFSIQQWNDSAEMENWAIAERDILAAIKPGNLDYQQLNIKITAAYNASKNAQAAVDSGILSKEVYDYAVLWVGHWHQELEEKYGGMSCYMVKQVPPAILDINRQLCVLEDLRLSGKIDPQVEEQARNAIVERLRSENPPKQAEELNALIMGLTGF